LNFHRNGRLAGAVLARDHVLFGREFPRGTHVSLDQNRGVTGVTLREDRDIDGIPVKAGAPELKFHDNGRLGELTLTRDHVVAGRRYERWTRLRFDRDGRVIYAQDREGRVTYYG
jgi:hypothetical protein